MNRFVRYQRLKWLNLILFGLMYNTVYIGRFNLNYVLEQVSVEFNILPYQETLLYSSVFIAYAAGSLINGRLADLYNPRRMILIGSGMSILANICVAFSISWQIILVLWIINGYFQSMIWVSGINLLANWYPSDERGKSCGIANFFSGLSHVTAYLLPAAIAMIYPAVGWRANFFMPMLVMAVFLLIFYLFSKEKPETVGLEPYLEVNKPVAEKELFLKYEIRNTKRNPWVYYLKRRKFLWWCGVALLSSLCRYGLLVWIPLYYSKTYKGQLLDSNFSNLTLPLGMAAGTLILTWLTGRRFNKNKGIMVIVSAVLCGTLVVTFPTMMTPEVVMIGIFLTGFFLYGINGILWIYAMDEGGRIYSGTVAGMLNCCAYIGAALETFIFPGLLQATGTMISIFIAMELICIAMMVCGLLIVEKDTSIEVEPAIEE